MNHCARKLNPQHEIVCECLCVTEAEILKAIKEHRLKTVSDIVRFTQAGDGCTACHPRLKWYLEQAGYLPSADSPI